MTIKNINELLTPTVMNDIKQDDVHEVSITGHQAGLIYTGNMFYSQQVLRARYMVQDARHVSYNNKLKTYYETLEADPESTIPEPTHEDHLPLYYWYVPTDSDGNPIEGSVADHDVNEDIVLKSYAYFHGGETTPILLGEGKTATLYFPLHTDQETQSLILNYGCHVTTNSEGEFTTGDINPLNVKMFNEHDQIIGNWIDPTIFMIFEGHCGGYIKELPENDIVIPAGTLQFSEAEHGGEFTIDEVEATETAEVEDDIYANADALATKLK